MKLLVFKLHFLKSLLSRSLASLFMLLFCLFFLINLSNTLSKTFLKFFSSQIFFTFHLLNLTFVSLLSFFS
ncbi:hypothetical protein GLOIN_2v1606504 [Rhizophagus irregularis DAOM 181602=DAOM 197198]|uniref:Uncharacterized protein n=1 Tax=Rhizophagus irregularis (strain DAOM 181602 / DAOM 197198 / MUCL 43194) TaxID=747089 RepID=A0A2P4Q0W9_RHIID|nr:hypothetical protein GLOIN_2v1606504 [Rhizophagus irregularis DAOM 181602=DAOM 197198]POG71291.1 hypothetical protein GLOIN_2v1606504 [Rhizophagus irregularis DAOM 181602=DAOM 197198]|eukprot:XP_025178157.1 hypothetical protein GLOIN_2v1606504 [Rhizophagus irregularis DAOM 181602=DAOM 197198]